jgi:hypothetical protein
MNMKNFREGLAILAAYFDKPDGLHGAAEHDLFYVYPTDRPVSPGDVQKLIELHWFQEDADKGDDEDFAAKHYDAELPWTASF